MLAAGRALHEHEQAKARRLAVVQAALQAEGLQAYDSIYLLPGMDAYVGLSVGSVKELVAVARQLQQHAEEVQARRTRIEGLMAAEGLQQQQWLEEVEGYVCGQGSEAGAMAAARAAAMEAAQRKTRRDALAAALAAEGLSLQDPGAHGAMVYIISGRGSLQAGEQPAAKGGMRLSRVDVRAPAAGAAARRGGTRIHWLMS